MSARLTSDFWVSAYRMRLEAMGAAVYVAARGDPTAGAVFVKLSMLDGRAELWGRSVSAEGERVWARLAEGAEAAVDEAAARQRRYDPDCWLVEVEDRRGRALLDDPSLA
jgi:hypothetical protein